MKKTLENKNKIIKKELKKKKRSLYKILIELENEKKRISKNILIDNLRIGYSLYNDIVLLNEKKDKTYFNFVLKYINNSIIFINLSSFPIYINGKIVNFLDYFICSDFNELKLDGFKLIIRFLNYKYKKNPKINFKKLIILCPYCGFNLNMKEKYCEFCGFDGEIYCYKFLKRYDYYYDLLDYSKENYSKMLNLKDGERLIQGLPKAEIEIIDKKFKGFKFEIIDEITTVGRSIYNTISLSELRDLSISRYHFKIIKKLDGYYIEDNQSLNGTYLNGKLIKLSKLNNGDIIMVGNTKIKFKINKEKEKKLWLIK